MSVPSFLLLAEPLKSKETVTAEQKHDLSAFSFHEPHFCLYFFWGAAVINHLRLYCNGRLSPCKRHFENFWPYCPNSRLLPTLCDTDTKNDRVLFGLRGSAGHRSHKSKVLMLSICSDAATRGVMAPGEGLSWEGAAGNSAPAAAGRLKTWLLTRTQTTNLLKYPSHRLQSSP